MLKTGQINTIIMQKNYKCTVCLTDSMCQVFLDKV